MLLVFFAVTGPAFPASLEELVGAERAATLRATAADTDSLMLEVQLRDPVFRLLPSHAVVSGFVNSAKNDLNPGILAESLFVLKKTGSTDLSEDQWAALFNTATAVSTLSGIQYFSASRGRMRTFYESSVVVDSPENRKPLADPVFSAMPQTLVLYARQKDLTFGDNTYRFEYHSGHDFMLFVQENITPMNVGIIPAIGRNSLRVAVAVIDAGDSLLIYAAAMTRAAAIPGMSGRIGSSLGNRLQAVLRWFSDKALAVI